MYFLWKLPTSWKTIVNDPTVLQALRTASFAHSDNRRPGCQIFIPNATRRASVERANFRQRQLPPLLPSLSQYVTSAPSEMEVPKNLLWSKRTKLFHLWNLWLGTFQNVLAYSVDYHWNTTSSSQHWSTLSPSAGKDRCFVLLQKLSKTSTNGKWGEIWRLTGQKRIKSNHSESNGC